MRDDRPAIIRFWSRVADPTVDGCWLWTAGKSEGYGSIYADGKVTRAHVLSWELHFGNVPDGLCVLHRCDVRACVNPLHLFLGTRADNIDDMRAKGRANDLRGEAHPRALLDAAGVSVVRQLLVCGVSGAFLATCFDVRKQTIYEVKHRRTWRHIP